MIPLPSLDGEQPTIAIYPNGTVTSGYSQFCEHGLMRVSTMFHDARVSDDHNITLFLPVAGGTPSDAVVSVAITAADLQNVATAFVHVAALVDLVKNADAFLFRHIPNVTSYNSMRTMMIHMEVRNQEGYVTSDLPFGFRLSDPYGEDTKGARMGCDIAYIPKARKPFLFRVFDSSKLSDSRVSTREYEMNQKEALHTAGVLMLFAATAAEWETRRVQP